MFTYSPFGDSALIIKAGNDISRETNNNVHSLLRAIETERIPGIVDVIPAYNELTILYDPLAVDFSLLLDKVKRCTENVTGGYRAGGRIIHIPVAYGGEYGPDLQELADARNMTQDDIVKRHTAPYYPVYMLGFTPGFCYLGGLDDAIATPRRSSPRTKIPAGSVSIADKQTGIYPIDSPGGWNLIGRTPLKIFDANRKEPFLIQAGDLLKFHAVSADEYAAIQKECTLGTYGVKTERDDQA